MVKTSWLNVKKKCPIRAPAQPVTVHERPKAAALVRAGFTPIAWAEISESRSATKARPSGARRRFR